MNLLNLIQIIISILLIVFVLLQQRGGGLSTVFGGEGTVYRTRRGVEKGIFWGTIILAALFLATAFFSVILR